MVLLLVLSCMLLVTLYVALRVAASSAPQGGHFMKTLAGAGLSIGLEMYDYSLYGFFATDMGNAYLPPSMDAYVKRLVVFTIFWGAFLVRPVGGLIFGQLGDTYGRATCVRWAVGLMILATTALGAIPPYAWIGNGAPLLLLAARLLQGMALGGQLGGAALLSLENAPKERRGFVASIIPGMLAVGAFAASAVATIFKETGIAGGWHWRVPFVAALLVGLLSVVLLWSEEEADELRSALATSPGNAGGVRGTLKWHLPAIIRMVVVGGLNHANFYFSCFFVPMYLNDVKGISYSYELTAVSLCIGPIVLLVFGYFGDRWRSYQTWQMIFGALAFAVLAPLNLALWDHGTLGTILVGGTLYAVSVMPYAAPLYLWNLEQVSDPLCRYTAISLAYNLDVAIFGGSAPDLAMLMTKHRGLVACWPYLSGLGVFAAAVLYWSRPPAETQKQES